VACDQPCFPSNSSRRTVIQRSRVIGTKSDGLEPHLAYFLAVRLHILTTSNFYMCPNPAGTSTSTFNACNTHHRLQSQESPAANSCSEVQPSHPLVKTGFQYWSTVPRPSACQGRSKEACQVPTTYYLVSILEAFSRDDSPLSGSTETQSTTYNTI
jgi:hypothetical protein